MQTKGLLDPCLKGLMLMPILMGSSYVQADEHHHVSINQSVPASIISLQNAWISAEVAANIKVIKKDVGDKVKKGSVLAQLDCREFEIQQQQAKADLASLKAKLPGIQARIDSAKSEVVANKSSVRLLKAQSQAAIANVNASQADVGRIQSQRQAEQAQCRLATQDLQRARTLRQQELISQQALEQAETTYRAAQAACKAVQPELSSANAKTKSLQASASAAQIAIQVQQAKTQIARGNIKVIEAEKIALKAQIQAAATQLETESLMVSRCSLKAPFSGEIIQRELQIGQRIGIGEKAFRLISSHLREVTASVSSEELKQIQAAKRLYFKTPEQQLAIKLRATVGLVQGDARTQEVRFTFNKANKLPIGSSGRVVWEGMQ